jgi:hypothetical protein
MEEFVPIKKLDALEYGDILARANRRYTSPSGVAPN